MNMITRREAIAGGALATALAGAERIAWMPEWDRALIQAAVAQQDSMYDPQEQMVQRRVGPDYNYHSQIRSRVAHPTRESLVYALNLLESGSEERVKRAAMVLERLLAIQDVDPASKWYGIWGYYLEEPPPKMLPADWNWADFNGSSLLLIAYRHASKLPEPLVAQVREGIRHAAASVRRRNVSMTYTNIAIQGTFVTLASAQLLDDPDLRAYAIDRLRRFTAALDQSGSFNEYNSPTYANVSIVNLTRIRMTVRDADVLALTGKVHERAWLHLGRHWHAPTRQLAGPMSRCYSTDLGAPLWIQKALNNRLTFVSAEEITGRRADAEVAIHDYRCPESVAPMFLEARPPHQHRETFITAAAPVRPVQGTTWLDGDFCLGAANRSDFWIQRRPLLAYWGGPERPARFVQMRFIKDDYDFSSALLYSVQERNFILGLVNFRSPGGDRHISLDPIQDGEFTASRLRLCLDITGAGVAPKVLAGDSRYAVDLGGAKLWFAVRQAVFGTFETKLSAAQENGRFVISLDLIPGGLARTIRWADIGNAWAAFSLAMSGSQGSLADFDRRCRRMAYESPAAGEFRWHTAAGALSLKGSTTVRSAAEQDRAFAEFIDDRPVPVVRLSDDLLA
jgi:hypothetical protein